VAVTALAVSDRAAAEVDDMVDICYCQPLMPLIVVQPVDAVYVEVLTFPSSYR
jgi:hypothetical protein